MKATRNTYFRKIFTVLLLIGTIPVFILMFAVSSMTSAQTEILFEMQDSSINNKRRQIEANLEYLDNSLIHAGLSAAVIKSVRRPREAKYFQEFHAVSEQINLVGSLAFPIRDIMLVSNRQGWIMTPKIFMPAADSEYTELVNGLSRISGSSFWYDDADCVYLVEQIPVNTRQGNGMLIARIDKNKIMEELNVEPQNERVVILDEHGNCIVGDQEVAMIVNAVKASDEKWQALLNGQPQQTSYHKENYVCAVSRSEFNNWTYVSVVLNSELKQGVESVYQVMWIVISSVILVLLTLVYRFSKILYHPIGELNELVDNNLSGDEQEALALDAPITSKVSYLVKRNVELKKRLSDREEYVRESYLRKIYRNEAAAVTCAELIRYKVISEPIDERHMHVIAVKYYLSAEYKKDPELCLFGIKNIIQELIGTDDSFVPVGIDHVVYITHFREYMSAEGALLQLQRTCEMIVSAIAQYMGVRVNLGVSRTFLTVETLPQAVEECKAALRKTLSRSSVCVFAGVSEDKGVVLSEIRIKEKRLRIIRAVLEGTEEECQEHLNAYFQKLDGIDYYLFKLEISKLLSDILDCYNEYSLQPEYEKMKAITDFDVNKDLDSIEKLKLYFWEHFLMPLNRKVSQPVESRHVMMQIAEYLNQNIEQDISLEQCAKRFNYNPSYLSRMFKKQFSKTYTEYMLDKKLERCKELLAETDLSINDISMRLGYNSPQNFIRVFKKYTLQTPGKYRVQYRQGKEKME